MQTANEGKKQDLNSGVVSKPSLLAETGYFPRVKAFWQPCDPKCHAHTRFWLWLCHTALGVPAHQSQTRSGEGQSSSMWLCWEEQVKGSVTPRTGSGQKRRAVFASLREQILARPRGHYLSSASARGSEEVAVTGIPRGGQSGSHEVISSPFERTVWAP